MEGPDVISIGNASSLKGATMTLPEQAYLNFDEPRHREIPLTRGFVTIVDAEDYAFLSQWTWKASVRNGKAKAYAERTVWSAEHRKVIHIYIARLLLGLQYGDKREADHINRDTLDNRRSNLRIATRSQNNTNRVLKTDKNSGLRGVRRVNRSSTWEARIFINKKEVRLGCYRTAEEAHAAYCAAAKEHFGEFAVTEGRSQ